MVPEQRIPEVGARVRDLQEPDAEDVHDGRRPSRAPSTCSTSPRRWVKKFKRAVTDSGTDIVRRDDKPGVSNLIEILAVIRGTTPEAIEREFAGGPLRRLQGRGGGGGGRLAGARPRALRGAAADEAALEDALAAGAEKAREMAAETLADVREAMGVGRPASGGPGA